MELPLLLVRDPEKTIKSLVKKITHSGEQELNKELVNELKAICKASQDKLTSHVFKECMSCLRKDHSQVRVACVKLIDYFFRKSHIMREKILDSFDTFMELTLAVSQRPDIKLKLPPPKKFAALLQEFTAKIIHQWHSEYNGGYNRLRYVYKHLKEHKLVDFSQFRVQTQEDLIAREKLLEKQQRILNLQLQNRMKDFAEIKPEIESLTAQIESLLDILIPVTGDNLEKRDESNVNHLVFQQQHGISNLSNTIDIEFSPYLKLHKNLENKETITKLKELKKQLVEFKLPKLISIEKCIVKGNEEYYKTLREIIDIKTRSTNLVLKLSELHIVNEVYQGSESSDDDASDFEEVQEKDDLETYIPRSMRFEYGLEPIDPKELKAQKTSRLVDESFDADNPVASTSASSDSLVIACNVRLESGKLCPRRDKIKCPFHGKIILRDHKGIPVDEEERRREEKLQASKKPNVPDWQDPELLRDIQREIGIDLTMPSKGKKSKKPQKKKLVDTRTCDTTPQQRLKKRLRVLAR